MSFVEQDDVINLFEGMAKYLFKEIRGVEMNEPFMRMPWADAMKYYGSDKPDLRFGMKFVELMDIMKDTDSRYSTMQPTSAVSVQKAPHTIHANSWMH